MTRRTILVVDDHVDSLRAMAHLLALAGHEVRAAATAAEARRLGVETPPDVLLSDLELGDGNGFDLLRQLRSASADVCGIAVSGYDGKFYEDRCRAAGFKLLLTKPVDFEQVLSAIDSCLASLQGVSPSGAVPPVPPARERKPAAVIHPAAAGAPDLSS